MRADDGPRPDPKIAGTCGKSGTYQPMRKKGAIILATGGDNSNSAMGKFCTRDAPSPFFGACLADRKSRFVQTRASW